MILEGKISKELDARETELVPIRARINNEMSIYGDTDFRELILKNAIYFSLEHAVHLGEEKRLELYRKLKINMK